MNYTYVKIFHINYLHLGINEREYVNKLFCEDCDSVFMYYILDMSRYTS